MLAVVLLLAFGLSGTLVHGEGTNPTGARPLAPTTGTINNLVVFIRFSDQPEFSQPLSYYDEAFNSASNSLKNYYLENSYGSLTVNSTFYPASSGSIIAYQDAHPTAYYQVYNAVSNPVGYQGSESTDRETALVANALNAISAQIPAGLNLDGNGDGYIDHITFEVYSTTAHPLPVLFYSRASYDWSGNTVINGKHVGAYTWVTATQDTPNTGTSLASTEIHEMGHSLGYPDLRANSGRQPVGDWDVMATSRVVHSGAYMKYRFTNWISNIPEITAYGSYTLNDLSQATNSSYKIRIPNSSEYLVLEYRKVAGAFESNLFGSGLCVTRVNEAAGTWGNLGGPPFFLYYYRLDGTASSDGNGNAWNACFNSESGRTQFNDHSNPACFLSDGSPCGISVSSIGSAAGKAISFALSDPATVIVTRRISGMLSVGNTRVSGATVTLAGDANGVTTSDSLGNYVLVVNDGGSYTVTPVKANLSFTPANKSFTNVTSDQSQNFTAAYNTNTISGTASIGAAPFSGMTVVCNGCTPQTLITDAAGAYSFTVNAGGTYQVYPGASSVTTGYSISPNLTTFTNITSNQVLNLSVRANSATTLVSSANPGVFAQSVTFTAIVTGSAPSGSVTFSSSGGALCAAVPLSNGQARCTSSTLSVGNRSITAAYSGDSSNTDGTSATLTQVITAAAASVPGAPTSVVATAGNAKATVTFAAPAANGGSAISAYTVISNPAGGIDSNAGTTATTHTVANLSNGTAYTFTVTASNNAGSGPASAASSPVTPMGSQAISFGTAPTILVGGTGTVSATATSGLSINLTAMTTNVCTLSGSTVTGLSAGTCIIAANQPGNASYAVAAQVTQSFAVGPAPVTTTTSTTSTTATTTTTTTTTTITAPAGTLGFAPGWNLLGNGSNASIDVATTFADASRFQSIWKWSATQSIWEFYAPALAAQGGMALSNYLASRGYRLLTTIAGGEGYWVNARQSFTLAPPSGTPIAPDSFQAGKAGGLRQGWNLVSIGTSKTPFEFNLEVGSSPSAPNVVPANITSLWVWDNARSNWYFYAPSLAAQGGTKLSDYINSKAYLDFTAASKTLGPGVGFWVNLP